MAEQGEKTPTIELGKSAGDWWLVVKAGDPPAHLRLPPGLSKATLRMFRSAVACANLDLADPELAAATDLVVDRLRAQEKADGL